MNQTNFTSKELEKIPIVMACDDNYVVPTYIAIYSALLNHKSKSYYDFYILCPENISREGTNFIKGLKDKFMSFSVKIVDMGTQFSDLKMKISHISYPTFYRLCLPEVLSNYNKCIYLDSDTLVCEDLLSLYNTDLQGYSLAGVLSEGIISDKIGARELCKRIGLPNVNTYINAGVLVMNLERIRELDLMHKWLELSKMEFPAQDQDILNLSCFEDIKVLPLKYNSMTKYEVIGNKKVRNKRAKRVYSEEEIREANTKPVIIHYADRIKPWNDMNSFWADKWWSIVYSIDEKTSIDYINEFVLNNKAVKNSSIYKIKTKAVRFSQILGVYSFIKRIEDKFKHNARNI